jgi:aminomethyltransferase
MKKSAFFDFLNRRSDGDFDHFLNTAAPDDDYINWNGYLLPQHYGDPAAEYQAIRNRCAIFDVSPIRKIRVAGPAAGTLLDYLFTRPVSTFPVMRGIYGVFCNEDGTLKDDAIVYKLAEDDYLLMPSDIDHSAHLVFLGRQLGLVDSDVEITECTMALAGVAVQGPMAAAAVQAMGFDDVETLEPFEVRRYGRGSEEVLVARMGFTADLGYECWVHREQQQGCQERIETARAATGLEIPGYGLMALESCRLEGGFIVAGWDFATEADPSPGFERNPYEVGLGWLVKCDGPEFYGRGALITQREEGHRYLLRTVKISSSQLPEDGAELYASRDGRDQQIGTINCSAWSGLLDRVVGNASIDAAYSSTEQAWLELDGERVDVALGLGPHINLDRRIEVPAPIPH